MEPLSPLAPLHPDGGIDSALVLGGACPELLIPSAGEAERLSLVVFAPTRAEVRQRGWLDAAATEAVERVAADGLVYVLVARRWRRKVVRALVSRGVVRAGSFVHLPDAATSRALVPLVPQPAEYALTNLIATRRVQRTLGLVALKVPYGRQLIEHAASEVGIVLRRPGARPLFAWFSRLASDDEHGHAVVTVTWRRPPSSLVVHGFSRGGRPTAVAKIGGRDAGRREAELLRGTATTAQDAGAEVPAVLALDALGDRSVLLQSTVAGRSAAALLAETPAELPALTGELVAWLRRWNERTESRETLSEQHVEDFVLRRARAVAPLLSRGEAYVSWAAARWQELVGAPIPFVTAHNDLTMVNVFVDGQALGVVDWATAAEKQLPLVDFYYAAVDAAAASTRYLDRHHSFRECFGGDTSTLARDHESRLLGALGLTPALAELCYHACWLRYAAIEQRDVAAPGSHAFLKILQEVADRALAADG